MVFETKKIALQQSVLVIGGGIAGIHTAQELKSCGYETTLIERSDTLGGQSVNNNEMSDFKKILSRVDVLTQSELVDLTGHVGAFTATVKTPKRDKTVLCGAVVLATGIAGNSGSAVFNNENIVPITEVKNSIAGEQEADHRTPVGLVLDLNIEETKAGAEMVLNLAMDLQLNHNAEVYIFCREIRVASLELETLYDTARDASVNIIKYEGAITFAPTENGIAVTTRDVILNDFIEVVCERVGISPYGLDVSADSMLAEIVGVNRDALGQMQDNNVHFFPGRTNRPGVFVVGACRGQYYVPQIITDAKSTALSVHSLLAQKNLVVELSHAVVDEEKCALCLTCIRSCPHKAMIINQSKKVAEAVPEACQKCGICVGECPAKAIELPAYTDDILLGQVG